MIDKTKKLRLVCTCRACPEQYDVYDGDDLIGYMRLRHGYFRAEYRGKVVYETQPQGDGLFYEHERRHYLNTACLNILLAHGIIGGWDDLFTIEESSE